MNVTIRLIALALATAAPAITLADSRDVVVEQPWSRASIGTARPGVVYMRIRNAGEDPVTLTDIRTGVAMMAQVHRTTTSEGVSRMAPAGDLEIAPGDTVALEPGGLHGMLMKLQQPLSEGADFPLVLIFDDGGEISVTIPVLGMAARGPDG